MISTMTSLEGTCSLCLNAVDNQHFEVITEATKDILNVCSLKLVLDEYNKQIICGVCCPKLLAAFQFKASCIYTDDAISPYVDCENLTQLDLRDIYVKQMDDKETALSQSEKICRLCMELTGTRFVPLQELDMVMIRRFLPEINTNIIKDPVVCSSCSDSFTTHTNFLQYCLKKQEAIETSYHLKQVGDKDESSFQGVIKTEEVCIKSEDDLSYDSCSDLVRNYESEEIGKGIKAEPFSNNSSTSEIHPSESIGKWKSVVETNKMSIIKIENSNKFPTKGPPYKCPNCDFETKYNTSLQNHLLRHKDPSQLHMYECDTCNYKTYIKNRLSKHQLIHKDLSQVPSYRCKIGPCKFETRYGISMRKHITLVHKDRSEVQMYKCDVCSYEAKLKDKLQSHQLIHKDPCDVRMFKCDVCSYETKFKSKLTKHMLRHKDASEVELYMCPKCDHKTKFKSNLRKHVLRHKE